MAINLVKLIQDVVHFAANEIAEVDDLKSQANDAIAQAKTFQDTVASDRTQIADLQSQVTALQARVTELESAESTLVAIADKFGIPVEQLPSA